MSTCALAEQFPGPELAYKSPPWNIEEQSSWLSTGSLLQFKQNIVLSED